jgi:hypothetical protein
MNKSIFSADCKTEKELLISAGAPISTVARRISAEVDESIIEKGNLFAGEITDRFVSDFEKEGDKMAHVSTFKVIGDTVYMTYYANTKEPSEDPKNQTARFVYADINDIDNKVFIDLQTTGDKVGDKTIDMAFLYIAADMQDYAHIEQRMIDTLNKLATIINKEIEKDTPCQQ